MTSAAEINPAVTVTLAATRKPADLTVITKRIREGTS
jgi:glycerol uptake facilitator-like aquaporin